MITASHFGFLRKVRRPVVLAAGFFDGVHRGHQKVLNLAVARAAALGGQAWALTFARHPLRVLAPAMAPRLLTTTPQRLSILERLGLDGCLLLPFTRPLARLEPEAFLDRLLRGIPTLTEVVVGANWRFGRGGRGDVSLLIRMGAQCGLRVIVAQPAKCGKKIISSTRIRQAVSAGQLSLANAMLGRPFSIVGRVVRGRRLGRRLGCPTANIIPESEVLPPFGVYAVWGVLHRKIFDGVANYGLRPTVSKDRRRAELELHLFDFAGNLYERAIEVFLVSKLREERRYTSLESLRRQITADVRRARRILRGSKKLKESLYTLGFVDYIACREK